MFNIKRIIVTVFAGVIFCVCLSGTAQANKKTTSNNASVRTVLQQSLDRYLKSYKQEKNNPIVIYNLAVIHYKLKKYSQAKSYFLKLLPIDSYHLLAKYNLGLVANKQGDRGEAISWFKKINNHIHAPGISNTEATTKLKKLAVVQIKKLTAETNKIKQKETVKPVRFKSYVFSYYGYEDKYVDSDGNFAPGDNFLNLYGQVKISLDDLITPGLQWRFRYYLKDYSERDSFDYSFIGTDISKLFKQYQWRHSIRLGFEQSTFGAEDYQSLSYLNLTTEYKVSDYKVAAKYFYNDIASDNSLYDDYAGQRQRLDLIYGWSSNAEKFRLRLSFEDYDLADKIVATSIRRSYSPKREKIEATWFHKFNKNWKSRLRFEYRDSRYKDFSVDDNVVRDEARTISSIQVKYRLRKNWWYVVDYRYTDNQSNIFRYDYTRNLISTGISGYF